MNLQGRNLQQGLNGSDVADAQSELSKVGLTIPPAEQQASNFGQGTHDAVVQFQNDHSFAATGVIDTATAAALGAAVAAATYRVHGTVWSSVSAGVSGLQIQIIDKNVGADVTVASGATNELGNYSITAIITPADLRARHKSKPDFQVRVMTGQTLLASSDIAYNAPFDTTLNVILPADNTALVSEYETLTAALGAVYQGALGALQENDQRQDITYLANKTGWDARAVAFAALADQFSQPPAVPSTTSSSPPPPSQPAPTGATTSVTGAPAANTPVTSATGAVIRPAAVLSPAATTVSASPPASGAARPPASNVLGTPSTPSAPAAPATIKPEFYYALFRAGLPTDADSLYQTTPQTAEAVWEQAITQGVIPRTLSSEIAGAVNTFQTLGAAKALDAKPAVGVSTLREMLAISISDANQQQQFAQLYAQYQGDNTGLWSAVTNSLGVDVTTRLQLDGKLAYISVNNAPLITALHNAEKASPLTAAIDLVKKGYYDAAKWQPLIGTSVPSQIPGDTAAEQSANYASTLAAQVRLAFPTAVVADLITQGKVPIQGDATVATGVTTFLNTNQDNFAIGREAVEAFIARTKLTGTNPSVVAQIKRIQRVYQLTPDDSTMSALLNNQVDSAYAITRYDSAGFVTSFKDKLGGEQAAANIYQRARQIHGSVLSVTMHYLTAQTGLQLGGATQTPILQPKSNPSANPNYPVIAYPTLETLFGSMDYCECEDCRSILSPAAYLVDLLHFIDAQSVPGGFQNPQVILFGRRPDLQYLPLTCANTNTAMPYIDLVNETLEYFVSHNLSLSGFTGFDTPDTITSADLIASPQNVNDAAYEILQNASFPPPLPYQRPLALLRLHLQTIGIALADVMAALRANDAIERSSPTTFGWRDILMEQIGLSREEYRLFTDSTLGLHGLYGYSSQTEAAALATLQKQNLQDFSRRTGVSYDDLFSIIQTQFINPNSILIPTLQQLNMPFSTLQQLQNGTLTPTAFTALLPIGIDPREYGGTSLTDMGAIATWVKNNYTRIMTIIAYEDPSASPDLCSATNLMLRYTNPDATKNLLHGADFLRLIRFIRLWQKLGISIEQTDDIITALYPIADLPTGASDASDYTSLDTGFLALLPRVGFLYQVMARMGLTTDSLPSLLACWAPIDTTGAESLYASMFLTTPIQDTAFAIDAYGNFLQDTTQTVGGHQATLCAAFNLTSSEFELVLAACALSDSSVLNLANISAIYRVGWMAHTLQLSVVEFLLLRSYAGIDPFQPLDPSATTPAEPPVIRFIRQVQAISTAGLQPVQALYLIWNQDVSGKSTPPDSDVTGLAVSLRADFAAVENQFTLVDDPSGAIANGLMALVYSSTATDFFFGLLNGTLTTSATYSSVSGSIPQAIIDASSGRLSYDDLRKQLIYAGVLDTATQSAIDAAITVNLNDPNLHAALVNLAAGNHQAVDPFFATYPELLPLYTAYAESSDPPQTKRTTLLATFLPSLKQKRKQEQALAEITAAAGEDPSFGGAILQNASVLHSAVDPTVAAIGDLTAIEAQGLSANFYLTNNTALPPNLTVDAVATMNYAPGSNPLPAGSGGSAIAGVWSGYLAAPQDGFYNIAIATDVGATVTLQIDSVPVVLSAAGNVWKNQSSIALTAGSLTVMTLTVGNIKSALALSWQSLGLGWQLIPGTALYPANLVARLRTLYVRFLKATALAGALSLTADELADLGSYTGFQVSTVDSRDNLTAGNVTFTPVSMTNIVTGSVLIIDSGTAQEAVTVTAVTATTFSAVTTKPHNGTATPFAIVNQSLPAIGHGWMNFISTSSSPDAPTSASLRDALTALLDYARIKTALSPGDERLLAAIQNPLAVNPDGSQPLLTLTGWTLDSVQSLLNQFFGDIQLSHLTEIENFRRVYDAYAIVSQCRVSASALIAATINDPTPASINNLQSALRALYAATDRLTVVQPINDTMRQNQRDALVAYILQQLGDLPFSTPPALTDLASVNTADKLFEFFLIDPETQPPVETSRVRLALSAVQLFIERCLRNLEPQVSPTNIDSSKWEWMKRYRVWEANREIFLWPENWLYPELRDDQSPIFQQMMSDLLQSDITADAAQTAYLNYLSNLEAVAKLEPCGLYHVPADPSESNEIDYVIGRTSGTGGKYYFRQMSNGSWSPWTQIPIDPDDLPVTPILWNGRLFAFWLKFTKQTPIGTSSLRKPAAHPKALADQKVDLESIAQAGAAAQTTVTVSAALCWSEFYNNKWQPTRTSNLHRQTQVGSFPSDDQSFEADRAQMYLDPTVLSGGDFDGALQLDIKSWLNKAKVAGGFVLHNTHSSPIRIEDMHAGHAVKHRNLPPSRTLAPVMPYTGGSVAAVVPAQPSPATFAISYQSGVAHSIPQKNNLLKTGLVPRYVQPQSHRADVWDAPFFLEDQRNAFYVTSSNRYVSIYEYDGYRLSDAARNPAATAQIPGLVLQGQRPAIPDRGDPSIFGPLAGAADAYTMQAFVQSDPNIRSALGSTVTASYHGRTIGPDGSLTAPVTNEIAKARE